MENSWQLFLSGRVAEAYQQCEELSEDSLKSFFIRAYCLRYGFGVKKNVSEAVNNCMRVYESEDDELEPRIADMRVLTLGELALGALRVFFGAFFGWAIAYSLSRYNHSRYCFGTINECWLRGILFLGAVIGCFLAVRYIRRCFPAQMKRRIQGIVASQTRAKHAVQKPLAHGRAKRFVGFLKSKTMLSVFGVLLFAVGYLASSLQTGSFGYWDVARRQAEKDVVTQVEYRVAYEFGKTIEKLSKDETYASAIELLGKVKYVSAKTQMVKEKKWKFKGAFVIASFESGVVRCVADLKFHKDGTFTVEFISLEESILVAITEAIADKVEEE